MRGLALIVGWIWLGVIWIAGCWGSVASDKVAWLVFWILFPPGAWFVEVIGSFIMLFSNTGVAVVGLVFLLGWIPLLVWGGGE